MARFLVQMWEIFIFKKMAGKYLLPHVFLSCNLAIPLIKKWIPSSPPQMEATSMTT
jgi:hypothetical protein